MAASEIANELGMICSLMPKPFSNRPGNGMHMHMSIGDGKKSLFEDESDKTGHGLSKLAYHFMGGILAHAPAITALACPTINSYKRLVVSQSVSGSTWAPAMALVVSTARRENMLWFFLCVCALCGV